MKNTMSVIGCLLLSLTILAQSQPLPNAHAHNDYLHKKPLHDALVQGFTSVEADIYLIKGELYVYHIRPLFKSKKRTLSKLYLEPLKEIITKNKGAVHPNYKGHFYLMIDIKTDAIATYEVLKKQLAPYQQYLTKVDNGVLKKGAITIFLSGRRPTSIVKNEAVKYVGIDGRPSDLGKGYAASWMPVVSDNFKNILTWNGKGTIPNEELMKLKNYVEKAHNEGKKVRLWAAPDNKNTWKVLKEAGVDLINTDKLVELAEFLKLSE